MQFSFVLFVFWFIYLCFWPMFFGRVFEVELHLPEDHFEGGHLVWVFFSNFWAVFDFEGKAFWLLTTTTPQCCQKCTLCASGTNLEKNCFEKKIRPQQFSDFKVDCFRLSVGISRSFVKFSSYVSKQTFWNKIYLLNSFFRFVFGTQAKTIRTLGANFLGTIFKNASTCP